MQNIWGTYATFYWGPHWPADHTWSTTVPGPCDKTLESAPLWSSGGSCCHQDRDLRGVQLSQYRLLLKEVVQPVKPPRSGSRNPQTSHEISRNSDLSGFLTESVSPAPVCPAPTTSCSEAHNTTLNVGMYVYNNRDWVWTLDTVFTWYTSSGSSTHGVCTGLLLYVGWWVWYSLWKCNSYMYSHDTYNSRY